ncbi:hypothetical protein [Winogradskyella poriferorum]|uniref:hypothetical protein n=1 Tax=Winogradskyella poriferorum TaxID=307627 RepID=UPI003D656A8A
MEPLTSLFCINPDIDKINDVISKNYTNEDIPDSNKFIDLKDTFSYATFSNQQKVLAFIKDFLTDLYFSPISDEHISQGVLLNSLNVFNSLYPSIVNKIDIENVYRTNYGNMVVDFEKNNGDVFSLEISANSIGYFIEVNGKDIKQIDNLILNDKAKAQLNSDITCFLA